MNKSYSFLSTWRLKAPLESVWQCMYESERWPEWWNGVIEVKEIVEGDERGLGSIRTYTLTSPARYKLTFNMEFIERIDHQLLKGRASGDLEGTGAWIFREEEGGITTIECHWHVATTLKWMNYLAFLLEPFFRNNHSAVMNWGAKGLAKRLDAELISY